MRVTIGQINTTNGDYAGNVERVLRAIDRARADKADLVVLPEVAVQGYMSFDWFLDRDVVRHVIEPLDQIVAASAGLTIVVGTVRPNESPQGRRLFNSAAVISDGKLLGYADKTLLPEYDVFDDPRYFEPAKEQRLFEIAGNGSASPSAKTCGTIRRTGASGYTRTTRRRVDCHGRAGPHLDQRVAVQ